MVLWQAVGEHVQLLVLAASSLVFAAPVPWSKREVLTMMSESGRLQSVTLPSLIAKGAESFCWINAGESFLLADAVPWVPSRTGCFLYA